MTSLIGKADGLRRWATDHLSRRPAKAAQNQADADAEWDEPPKPQPETPMAPWSAERVAAVESLWGDGFVMPGGAREVLLLAAPLALTADLSLLLIGAGTGGPARALIGASGCQITALEANRSLAELAATRLAASGKMAVRVLAVPWGAPVGAIPGHSIDRCLALSPLRGDDPTRLITMLARCLKPGGEMVLVDLVADAALNAADPIVAAWSRLEPRKPILPSERGMSALLRKLGLEPRPAEDITARHIAQVLSGWQSAAAVMESTHPSHARAAALAHEAELWQMRLQLLQDGRVRAIAWHAVRG